MLSRGRHLAGRNAALTGGMHRRVLACLAWWTPVDVVVIQVPFTTKRNTPPKHWNAPRQAETPQQCRATSHRIRSAARAKTRHRAEERNIAATKQPPFQAPSSAFHSMQAPAARMICRPAPLRLDCQKRVYRRHLSHRPCAAAPATRA
jgi:hypothetical protein